MSNEKNVGITTSEEYVGKLGKRSFLSLWCYLNLYKEQGKELCDMLVVLNNDVIIFSVKDIKFNRYDPVKNAEFTQDEYDVVAWKRWYKDAIDKSAKQIFGAEKWLKKPSSNFFWDASCKDNCLLNLPSDIKIHRVCVAWGISNECAEYYQNGDTGSLILSSALDGVAQHNIPFMIGQPNCAKGFVHVFDDFGLDRVFDEVDTATDFINYLNKREAFLYQNNFKFCTTGEEELLALYLTSINENNEHDFVLPTSRDENLDVVFLDQGGWEDLIKNKQYIEKKEADKDSYIWDSLIEKIAQEGHIYDNNELRKGEHFELKERLQYMSEDSRFIRRQLAKDLNWVLLNTPKNKVLVRVSTPKEIPKKVYILMVAPKTNQYSYDEYKKLRQLHLLKYCEVAKLHFSMAKYIIGLAVEPKGSENPTEDLIVLNVENWTDERKKHAQEIQNKFSILKKPTFYERKTFEYPQE